MESGELLIDSHKGTFTRERKAVAGSSIQTSDYTVRQSIKSSVCCISYPNYRLIRLSLEQST